jgi:hypothetical protein
MEVFHFLSCAALSWRIRRIQFPTVLSVLTPVAFATQSLLTLALSGLPVRCTKISRRWASINAALSARAISRYSANAFFLSPSAPTPR